VKRVVLKSGQILYCVWITRDSEDTAGKTQVSYRRQEMSRKQGLMKVWRIRIQLFTLLRIRILLKVI
jgi:hypothetical protein